jgi:hypothetical protein
MIKLETKEQFPLVQLQHENLNLVSRSMSNSESLSSV